MKPITVLIAVVLLGTTINAQKKSIEEMALQEIDSLAANALEFLGKTDSAIMLAGRPASIKGGDNWDPELIKTSSKNSMNASSTVIIGTGGGVLMIIISAKTGLAYTFTYLAHKKARLDFMDIKYHLTDKYTIDKTGTCIIKAKDLSHTALTILDGGIIMIATINESKGMRFYE